MAMIFAVKFGDDRKATIKMSRHFCDFDFGKLESFRQASRGKLAMVNFDESGLVGNQHLALVAFCADPNQCCRICFRIFVTDAKLMGDDVSIGFFLFL